MGKKEIHQSQVYECMQKIIKEVKRLDLRNKPNQYKDEMISIVVADESRIFGLKYTFMKAIYLGKSSLKYI